MNKLTVAAALIAALAVSAPAYADTAPKPTHAPQKATPAVKSNVRPERKPLLDEMSTQSIAPRQDAGEARVKTPVATTGIAVSPTFFSF